MENKNTEQVQVKAIRVIKPNVAEGQDFEPFVALDVVAKAFKQSKTTGRFYLTEVKASFTTTLDEKTAKSLLGSYLPGTIVEQECDEYEYTVKTGPRAGEVLKLATERVFIPA